MLLWGAIWATHTYNLLRFNSAYYGLALVSSLDELRAFTSAYDQDGLDYYAILKRSNELVPEGKKIKLALPQAPVNKYEFLREKGRYFLYPRNFGNNNLEADYILVYGADGFQIPANYRIYEVFSQNKYLLIKTDINTLK
jgi:hypothetical protein